MAESMRSSDYKVTWDVKVQAPFSADATGLSSASVGDKAYFMPNVNSDVVYEYLSSTVAWQELPPCGVWRCTLVNVRGTLTTVGGRPHVGTGIRSVPADCLCWDEASRCWESRYPLLPKVCSCPAVATTADHLIAVTRGELDVYYVWMMDINTRQWSSYTILLHCPRSVAVCNGTLYVACCTVGLSRCVLCHCSLDALLQSTPQQRVWQVTDCPGSFDSDPALVTVNNKLLCILKNTILIFEEKKNVFIPVESIPVCSDLSFGFRYVVCPLPGGRLLLCTGRDVILIGKFVSSGILNIVYRVQALLCSQFSSIAIYYVSL